MPNRNMRSFKKLATISIFILLSSACLACPSGQYSQCVLGACVCLPEVGGSVGAATEHIKKETQAQLAGNPLQVWIQQSRNSAIGTSMPVPPDVRRYLTGYIENDVMNRARYKIGDNGILNAANLTFKYGDNFSGIDAAAVTLIDVIVFRDNESANDLSVWAHELTHVQQYRDWGVRDFAIRYARDPNAVEAPAYAVGNNYASWRESHPLAESSTGGQATPVPTTYPGSIGGGLPSGFGMQTCGCWGPTPGVAREPRCASGGVRVNACAGLCPGGGQPYAWLCQ